MLKSILVLGSLFILSACATIGKKFELSGPQSIVIGKTTKSDLLATYGEPFRVGYDNDDEKWTYGHYKYRLFGESETKDLIIGFDKKGIVKEFNYSTSVKEEKKKFLAN